MYKKSKRQKVIDKKFQKGTAFKIISLSMLSYFIIISAILLHAYLRNKKIQETTNKIKTAIMSENEIIDGFIIYSKKIKNTRYALDSKMIEDDHKKNIEIIKENLNILEELLKKNLMLFVIIFIIITLYSVFMYFYIINFTHRISGPAYLISENIKKLLNNQDPDLRSLRKNDELKNLHKDFVKLAKKLKK